MLSLASNRAYPEDDTVDGLVRAFVNGTRQRAVMRSRNEAAQSPLTRFRGEKGGTTSVTVAREAESMCQGMPSVASPRAHARGILDSLHFTCYRIPRARASIDGHMRSAATARFKAAVKQHHSTNRFYVPVCVSRGWRLLLCSTPPCDDARSRSETDSSKQRATTIDRWGPLLTSLSQL